LWSQERGYHLYGRNRAITQFDARENIAGLGQKNHTAGGYRLSDAYRYRLDKAMKS
jgi:hypothetical protein